MNDNLDRYNNCLTLLITQKREPTHNTSKLAPCVCVCVMTFTKPLGVIGVLFKRL